MKIAEFDGVDVWFEQLEPLWTLDEVHDLNQQLLAELLEAHDLPVAWETRPCYEFLSDAYRDLRCITYETGHALGDLPFHARALLSERQCKNYRERVGLRRADGKPLQRRMRKAALDKMADEFGIPTREPGWEEETIEAIRLAPARGRITAQT